MTQIENRKLATYPNEQEANVAAQLNTVDSGQIWTTVAPAWRFGEWKIKRA